MASTNTKQFIKFYHEMLVPGVLTDTSLIVYATIHVHRCPFGYYDTTLAQLVRICGETPNAAKGGSNSRYRAALKELASLGLIVYDADVANVRPSDMIRINANDPEEVFLTNRRHYQMPMSDMAVIYSLSAKENKAKHLRVYLAIHSKLFFRFDGQIYHLSFLTHEMLKERTGISSNEVLRHIIQRLRKAGLIFSAQCGYGRYLKSDDTIKHSVPTVFASGSTDIKLAEIYLETYGWALSDFRSRHDLPSGGKLPAKTLLDIGRKLLAS